jgi:putative ABC transport system substrate-binding protein
MRRRKFLGVLGGAAAWPLAARGQQTAMPVIGILGSSSAVGNAPRLASFRQGLSESGFVEGRNLAMVFRWADDQLDRLPGMAADLVRRRVALIAAIGNSLPARAAKAATTTIPIVFSMGADPVGLGIVASLAKPGGNVTGITSLSSDQLEKRLQLLRDVVPSAKTFGLIINPGNQGPTSSVGRTPVELAQHAVRSWGGTVEVAQARTAQDFDQAFADLKQKKIDALLTQSDVLFYSGRERLVALAAQYRIPMILHATEAAQAGALITYVSSTADAYRQVGHYAARILKGEKPADLPVLLPTKFELVINLKTAKALGIAISRDLLLIADEVIE